MTDAGGSEKYSNRDRPRPEFHTLVVRRQKSAAPERCGERFYRRSKNLPEKRIIQKLAGFLSERMGQIPRLKSTGKAEEELSATTAAFPMNKLSPTIHTNVSPR